MDFKITPEAISEITGIRLSVLRFAAQMEKKLKENDHKDGWKSLSNDWLAMKIKEETEELKEAIKVDARRRIINEAADVANFAMMISDNNI